MEGKNPSLSLDLPSPPANAHPAKPHQRFARFNLLEKVIIDAIAPVVIKVEKVQPGGFPVSNISICAVNNILGQSY